MLVRDELDSYFLLNVLLTLLGWLPGLIHAVWVLLNRNPSAGKSAVVGSLHRAKLMGP